MLPEEVVSEPPREVPHARLPSSPADKLLPKVGLVDLVQHAEPRAVRIELDVPQGSWT